MLWINSFVFVACAARWCRESFRWSQLYFWNSLSKVCDRFTALLCHFVRLDQSRNYNLFNYSSSHSFCCILSRRMCVFVPRFSSHLNCVFMSFFFLFLIFNVRFTNEVCLLFSQAHIPTKLTGNRTSDYFAPSNPTNRHYHTHSIEPDIHIWIIKYFLIPTWL